MAKSQELVQLGKAAARKLVFDFLVKKAIARAVLAVPFLGLPFIGPFFAWVFTKGAELLYTELELGFDLYIIDARVQHNREAYDQAVKDLGTVLKNGASDEEKQLAKEEFKARLGSLIRFPRAS